MAKIRYRVRSTKDNSPIYLRFSAGREQQFELKSGYTIPKTRFFNNKTGTIKQVADYHKKAAMKKDLNRLANHIEDSLNDEVIYSKEWLKGLIDEHHGIFKDKEVEYLTQLIDRYIDHLENDLEDEITNSTLKSYKVTLFRIKEFEKHNGNKIKLIDINRAFKNGFVRWCKNVQKYQPSTYKKTLKQLRTICKDADLYSKIKIDNSFFVLDNRKTKAKKKAETKDRIFPVLTFEDIEKIKGYSGQPYLENVRDWLVISCWTAARVSDLMRFNTSMINVNIKGERCLEYTQFKTEQKVTNALHPDVEEILKRLGGFPKPISDQKYNSYIKTLCKEVKLNELIEGRKMNPETRRQESGQFQKWELVTSHIGRRSWATNHYGKFTNHQLMLYTGHQTERQFLDYIGKRSEDHLTDFMAFWKSLEDEKEENQKIG
jgi:hypothetical protein